MPDRHPPKYPRILVGIDLGLTCTGVAFSTTDWLNPKIIQTWPGISQIKNKVPTAVQYRAGNRDFKAWGFECPPPWQVQNQMGVKDLFKLFLDENCLKQTFESNQDFAVGTYQDVRNWYTDFLNAIYKYISAFIKENLELPDWKLHTVDFLFSYPTTWGEEVVAEFRKVVEAAGFGSGGKYHNVEVKLTEAEAAAIYTADSIRQEFPNTAISDTMSSSSQTCDDLRLQVGNVILVCDSGGGTTDVAVVEVRSLKDVNVDDKDGGMGRLAEFTPLGEPNGLPIGSVQIDEDFRCVLRRRLSSIPNVRIPDEVVDEVVRADFQSHKLNLGGSLELPICHFPIKGLGDSFTLEEARIEDGAVMFTRHSIRELFDDKISGICHLIEEQTDRLFEQHEGKKITHLMLSGGLCSSKYVQTQLKERHDGQMKILIAKDPQLAVCKGLVIDSLHRLKYNNYILPDRFINHSYGIVSNEIYNNRKHHRQRKHREKDLISGEELVRQIHWLIIRAKPISKAKPITHKFYRHVDIEQEDICWIDKIVTSRAPTQERLPTWDQEGDAEESCEIESRWTITDPAQFANMPGVKRKRRKEMGLAIGKEFWRVELKVLVWVRTRELQFDIEFANQVIGTGFVPISFIFGPRPSEAGTNKDGGGGGVSGSGESLPDQPPLIAK